MKKLALALAAAAALGLAAPVFTVDAAQAAVVKVKRHHGLHRGWSHSHHYGAIRHHRGLHRGWSHSHHYGAR